MEAVIGLLRIRVLRGVNLAARDSRSSDPYATITTGQIHVLRRYISIGDLFSKRTLKTRVVKNDCNPEWNDELTLPISHLDAPITLKVYDKDTLTVDDKMGEAEIDIKPFIECLTMSLDNLPNGCVLKRVYPDRTNCLAEESSCVWNDRKVVQNMCLRLKNVECGEVMIQLEWIDIPGGKGLEIDKRSLDGK